MGDFPDTSYVTEPQRRWITRHYGPDWDKPREYVKVSRNAFWLQASEGRTLSAFDADYKRAVHDVPPERRDRALVRVLCDHDSDCYLTISYPDCETERQFNQRIAGYLHEWEHEWEKMKADYLENQRLFDDGQD